MQYTYKKYETIRMNCYPPPFNPQSCSARSLVADRGSHLIGGCKFVIVGNVFGECHAPCMLQTSGADPGFQVRGRTWKDCAERREARTFLEYFVWKITMLRQKILFFPIVEGGAKMFRVFVWKITILRQKIIFFSILGGSALPPPLDPPLWSPTLSAIWIPRLTW